MIPPLTLDAAPGWYRGWNGTVHFFTEPRLGRTACEPLLGGFVTPAPWPAEWGPAKPERKRRCFGCERGLAHLEAARPPG